MAIILIAVFIDLVGFGLIVPILPFITQTYGGGALEGTALVSIYSLFAFLSGPLWGRLSDKIGRRPALMLTFFGGSISYLVLAFSDTLLMIFVARALSGAMAGNVGIVMAAMADLTTPENRGRAMGLIGAAFALGFAVGPGLAALLSTLTETTSILLPGLAASCLSFTALVLTARFMPETTSKSDDARDASSANVSAKSGRSEDQPSGTTKQGWRYVVSNIRMSMLMMMFAVMAIGQSINFSITPFWLNAVHGWTEREVGYLFMTMGLLIALVNIFIVGPLFKVVGEVRAILIGTVLFTTGSIGVWFLGQSLFYTFLCFPMLMIGLTLAFPAMNSEVSKRTDPSLQGAALGLSNGLAALGRVAGPLTAGVLFSPLYPSAPFLIVTIVGVIAFVWSLWDHMIGTPKKVKLST